MVGRRSVEVGHPRVREQLLAAAQLRAQRGQHPVGEVLVEVGDEADDVGQAASTARTRHRP